MKLIAHRGNVFEKDASKENSPAYIDLAIEQGYDVEVDLRAQKNAVYLGHDGFEYAIDIKFLLERQNMLWVHCKDREAFDIALNNDLNCFWHTKDDYTITKHGFVWAYPGKIETNYKCVMVLPEIFWNVDQIVKFTPYGICSDIVGLIKEKYDSLV